MGVGIIPLWDLVIFLSRNTGDSDRCGPENREGRGAFHDSLLEGIPFAGGLSNRNRLELVRLHSVKEIGDTAREALCGAVDETRALHDRDDLLRLHELRDRGMEVRV